MGLLQCEDIERFGQKWVWKVKSPFMAAHWKSTVGNLVFVFPPPSGPIKEPETWVVSVMDEEFYFFTGDDMEERAFSVAEIYTRQDRS